MSERMRALKLISKGATIDELRADSAVGAVCQSLLEDESFLVEAVQRYPYFVTQLDAPSEKVMLEAVKKYSALFSRKPIIDRQTEDIAFAAVSRDGKLLPAVEDQTEKVCLAAVKNFPMALRSSIDGPCHNTIPPYNHYVVLGPLKPDQVAKDIAARVGYDVAIVDINDLEGQILGASSKAVNKKLYARILKDNPLGQDDQQTPMGIIRRVD